jgi:wyosine [tRNA(Phe)-imidazoG37] synthetase (radical SAM superfamily)
MGINLLPTAYKLCSFDCVYCQYREIKVKSLYAFKSLFPSAGDVIRAIREALESSLIFDYLTFSGNGEPTLHPMFTEIVETVRQDRDELRPQVKITLLSNSSTAHMPRIRQALQWIDMPIMKLDAGDQHTFQLIDQPSPDVQFELIMEGLKSIPNLIIQSVFIDGVRNNINEAVLETWQGGLVTLKPKEVQIYSCDRPVASSDVMRVMPETLQSIAAKTEQSISIPIKAFWRDMMS